MLRRALVLLLAVVFLVVPSAVAVAQGSTQEQYPPVEETVPVTQPKVAKIDRPRARRAFAVTGSDLIVPAVVVGGGLVLVGAALAVWTRRRPQHTG